MKSVGRAGGGRAGGFTSESAGPALVPLPPGISVLFWIAAGHTGGDFRGDAGGLTAWLALYLRTMCAVSMVSMPATIVELNWVLAATAEARSTTLNVPGKMGMHSYGVVRCSDVSKGGEHHHQSCPPSHSKCTPVKAAAATGDCRCANIGCPMSTSGALGAAGVALQPQVTKAALGSARRQPRGQVQSWQYPHRSSKGGLSISTTRLDITVKRAPPCITTDLGSAAQPASLGSAAIAVSRKATRANIFCDNFCQGEINFNLPLVFGSLEPT